MSPPPVIREIESVDVAEDGRTFCAWLIGCAGETLLWQFDISKPVGQMQTCHAIHDGIAVPPSL